MAGPSNHVRFILLKENSCQDYYITVCVTAPKSSVLFTWG